MFVSQVRKLSKTLAGAPLHVSEQAPPEEALLELDDELADDELGDELVDDPVADDEPMLEELVDEELSAEEPDPDPVALEVLAAELAPDALAVEALDDVPVLALEVVAVCMPPSPSAPKVPPPGPQAVALVRASAGNIRRAKRCVVSVGLLIVQFPMGSSGRAANVAVPLPEQDEPGARSVTRIFFDRRGESGAR